MTTTDQQAVTVAQEDREAAAKLLETIDYVAASGASWVRDGHVDIGPTVQAFARHRLASVSSASAEAVAWCSPGQLANLMDVDVDGGVYLPIRKTERGNFTMPLYSASPEPVPATNQAGEVVAWRERDGDEWVYYDADSDTGKHIAAYQRDRHNVSVFPLLAALATQPATSQEGEGALDAAMRNHCLRYGQGEPLQPHEMADMLGWLMARAGLRAPGPLAATPTPPTEAREGEGIEAIAELDIDALASAIHDARWDNGRNASSWVPLSQESGAGKVYCLRIANAVQMHLLAALSAGSAGQ